MAQGARGARSQRPALPSKFQGGPQPCAGRLQGLPLQGHRALEGSGSSRCGKRGCGYCDSERLSPCLLLMTGAQGQDLVWLLPLPRSQPHPWQRPVLTTGMTSNGTHGDKQWDKQRSTAPAGNYPRMPARQRVWGRCRRANARPPAQQALGVRSLEAWGRWGRKGSGRDGPTWPMTSSS